MINFLRTAQIRLLVSTDMEVPLARFKYSPASFFEPETQWAKAISVFLSAMSKSNSDFENLADKD